MSASDFEGFWEDGNSLRAYIRDDLFPEGLLERLKEQLTRVTASHKIPPPTISVRRIQEQDWNAQWESAIEPIRVTDRLVIAPSWKPVAAGPQDIVLTIDPKMSFGTGYHETTRLTLRLIDKFCGRGSRVLDVGTGTGVLAIAAVKLGAAHAIGIDNDAWAYDNASENVRANGVEGIVEIRLGGLDVVTERDFDIIAANIQKNVIEGMLGDLELMMNSTGRLLLSGLLSTDRDAIHLSLRTAGLRVLEETAENEWIAVAVERT
jgi:ribosomal protein L11 methyltransferase